MEIQVKIKLSSGKEIELSKAEYDELKVSLAEVKEVQQWFPHYPQQPYNPFEPPVWYGDKFKIGEYEIGDFPDYRIITTSETVGDCNITTTKLGNGVTLTTASVGKESKESKEVEAIKFPVTDGAVHIY